MSMANVVYKQSFLIKRNSIAVFPSLVMSGTEGQEQKSDYE